MHGVAFNTDLYMGNTGKTDGVLYGKLAGDRDRRADAGQRLHRQRLPGRERRDDGGRQADPADHLELGQPAQHRELQHLRHAGRPTRRASGSTRRGATCPRRRASPTPTARPSHWLNGAIDVARTGTIIQFTAGNGGYANPTPRGAAPYFMPELEGTLVHDVGHQPRDRAHVQRRRVGPRPGAADVQPVRRREVVVRHRAGQQHQQHHRAGRQRRAAAALRERVGHLDGRPALGGGAGADHGSASRT